MLRRWGSRFILPSSFTGGPRFMAKLYQDSMAIVRPKIANISRSLELSQFNLASDYLYTFKMNSFIYRDHYLTEV
jgi:hypothetical protein